MRYRIVTLSALFLFYTVALFGQDKSNRGKEFWLGYGYNSWFFVPDGALPPNSQELNLYISTEAAATVTVSIPNTGWTQTLNIPANTVDASVLIPKSGANDARMLAEGLSNKAVHIVSDTPIVVYAHMYNTQTSGATMLIPVETYGYKYYSLNYSQSQSNSKVPYSYSSTTSNGNRWYSWFYVIAAEDNTRIEITPSDTTSSGVLPNQTITVNLNKGETYNVMGKLVDGGSQLWQASKDMTGSKVISVPGNDGNCHPIALFSGSGGIRFCYYDGGEVMMQQAFPVQAWGTRYLTYHMLNNTNTDINDPFKNFYRITVDDPTTQVLRNGVPLTGLINNFYYEIIDSTGGDYITADKPIMVAQYTPGGNRCWNTSITAYGDPEMIYLSPVEQGSKDVLFYANRKTFIDYNYLNVIVKTTGISSLRLDGAPFLPANIITHPNNPAYSVAIERVPGAAAQHHLVCDSIFNATIYGLGLFESYGYNVGTFVNNLNNYTAIRNTLNSTTNIDTFTCPKTPFRITAKLAYPATSITWRLSQVPGLFPNTDSVIATPVSIGTEIINGRTYYLYTLQQDFTLQTPGTYTIPLSYTAIGVENCSQTEYAKLEVLVKPGPVADFSFINQCFRDTVRFTGTSTTTGFTINSYLWTFHDATTQSTVNAKKLYPAPGNYDVRYQILADNGCFGDTTKNITVSTGTTPTLTITSSGKPCADSVITFTSSITPNVSNPTTWYWDFGDGQTATSNTSHITTHSYAANAGPITVKHLATLTTGCNPDTVTSVIPVINTNPVASFTVTGSPSCPSKPLQVTSSAANVNVWNWNFGNNSFGNQVPPFSYSYTAPGNFNIQLTVSDNNGCGSAVISNPVIINPGPSVNAGPDKLISLGTSTTLDATIVNAANYDFLWSPAQTLSSATILNPVATPDVVTTYTIIAADKVTGCSGRDAVVVSPIPKLYIPTGFTPNNDGKNDKWTIQGLALYPDAVVSVYNRWGEKVYETKNYYNYPWNGLYKGLMIPGLYVYVIKLYPDKPEVIKGMVTIIQ
jgi:gliding motility-associated-like protein